MKRFFTLLTLLIALSAILQAQTPWKFIVYGDTRTDDAAHRSVLQSISQNTPDYQFIINVGDCIQESPTPPFLHTLLSEIVTFNKYTDNNKLVFLHFNILNMKL